MEYELVDENSPVLSCVAEEVVEGSDVRELLTAMWKVMYAGKGIGLAANQVGSLERVIVVQVEGFKQALINPKIVKSYGGKHSLPEGCLSFPRFRKPVIRDKNIIVEGFTIDWKPIRRKLKGMTARVVQHEIDHLDGVTIKST